MDDSSPSNAVWSRVSKTTGKTMTVTSQLIDDEVYAVVHLDGEMLFGMGAESAATFGPALIAAAGPPSGPTNVRDDAAIPATLAELPGWAWTGRPAAAHAARLLGHEHGALFRPRYDTTTDLWFIEAVA